MMQCTVGAQARRAWWGLASTAVGLVLMALGLPGPDGAVHAQPAPAGDWEPTGLTDTSLRLFTPASGAFFALGEAVLFRSDDAGTTWQSVPGLPIRRPGIPATMSNPTVLPKEPPFVMVDPIEHQTIYGAGADGLYKTTDGATSWQRVLPVANTQRWLGLAVGPGDARLVYVALANDRAYQTPFLRSRDGGQTWEPVGRQAGDSSSCDVMFLWPHPTDPQQLFRYARCYGRTGPGALFGHSRDQGLSWSSAPLGLAMWLRPVGGQGSAPQRFYLAGNRDMRAGGGFSIFRTEDDGNRWTELVAVRRQPSAGQPDAVPEEPAPPWDSSDGDLGALAFDPANPDQVYAGLNGRCPPSNLGYGPPRSLSGGCGPSGVKASADAGVTWANLGRQDLPAIHDLALGVDGRNLYAATDHGVWRLRLGR